MRQYIARRLLLLIPTLLGVSIVIFTIMRILPGDVALAILMGEGGGGSFSQAELQELRHRLGADKPIYEQYVIWLANILQGDFGVSLWSDIPVMEEIAKRFPVTIEMALLTIAVSCIIAFPIGILSALRQDTWVDYVFRVVAIAGLAMPTFWLGILIILFLVILFVWMPPLGYLSPFQDPWGNFQQFIFPAVALGYRMSAVVSRMTRSTMLEVLREDYIRTAWAKGLRERTVVVRHALKNAVLPVVTLIGIQIAGLLGGVVITESVFALPGMGRHLVDSILRRDYPVVQAIVVIFSFIVVIVNLTVDLLYAWLDPRVRYQ